MVETILKKEWYMLFVKDDRTVILYDCLPTLLADIDAQDVLSDLYVVFHSSGQEFLLSVDRNWNVSSEPGEHNPGKLYKLILDFHTNEVPDINSSLSLSELVKNLERICRVIDR